MPTKDELAAELEAVKAERDELAATVDELRAAGTGDADRPVVNYRPTRPFLSEGERQDLEMHGVTNSPFTGERLTATGEDVEPRTATARKADERARKAGDTGRDRDVVGLDRIPVDPATVATVGAAAPADVDDQVDEQPVVEQE